MEQDAVFSTENVSKRKDCLSWDQYFMAMAYLSRLRSKDPSMQVGACVVTPKKRIAGMGYNGFPYGCSDDAFPWDKVGSYEDTKYAYVTHAEVNCILNKNIMSLEGCTLYTTLMCCNECAKIIIQSGITKIVYASDKHHDDSRWIAARRMLDAAGVEYVQYHDTRDKIVIDFSIEM